MSVSYEVDIKEVLTQINQKLDGMQRDFDQKLDTLQKDVTDLKVGVARLEERVNGLEDKIEGLSKRIDSQEFVSRGILIAFMAAVLGGLAKLFGFAGNP